jgi:tetratricopeptide (TPR) repeat protein
VFDLSYTSLPAPHQRLWRRLGLAPVPDLDVYAAAALAEITPAVASGLLEDLVDNNLLGSYVPGRYRLHDLLRTHARTLAAADPAPERAATVDRLLHYYAHTAQSASVLVARYLRSAPDGPAPTHIPALTDPEAADSWLRAEQPNLEAAFTYAHARGLERHAVALAAGLAEILQDGGHWARALEIHQSAAEAAERSGHLAAHANALNDLGRVRAQIGDYPGAEDAHTRALEVFRVLGNRHGEANALYDLGRVRFLLGDYPATEDAQTRALELFRGLGHRLGQAIALTELGRVRSVTADLPGAGDAYTQALELYRGLGHRLGEASALTYLGCVRSEMGDHSGAGDTHTRALEIFRARGDRGDEAWALNYYAAARAAAGDRSRAFGLYQQALAVHRELKKPDDEAVSLEGIADHHLATGDPLQGTAHLHQALEIYQRLGMAPDTRRVQKRLDALIKP